MAWKAIQRFFQNQTAPRAGPDPLLTTNDAGTHADSPRWVEARDNPWGVRVLDVRPLTLTWSSASDDPQCAMNAMSFGQDDGSAFIGQEPPSTRVVEAHLKFPIDRLLADGMLFMPRQMEHKWALFYNSGQVICVRSWHRQVWLVARLEQLGNYSEITEVRGDFGTKDEDPAFTVRALDYLLRSQALGVPYPAPLIGQDGNPGYSRRI